MSELSNPLSLANLNELSEARLWKILDSINDRLTNIEKQFGEIIRLEERINNHEQTLYRYGNRLDTYNSRLQETELWQATYGDKSSIARLVTNVQEELSELKKKVDCLNSNKDVIKNKQDTGKEVLKWVTGIFAAIIVYIATRG